MTSEQQAGLPGPGASKEEWRRWARRRRALLDPRRTGEAISSALRAWGPFARSQDVLLYLAFGSEPDLGPLLSLDKRYHVTRTGSSHQLSLHRLIRSSLEPHPYGFLQPGEAAPRSRESEIELVLVPGLAFDESGTRLGFGRGYYDRLLARFSPGVPFVGITAAQLIVERLPREPFDVPMTHLATEWGVTEVGDRGPD